MRLQVVRPGLLTTLQDGGRRGYESLGITIGGVLDDFAAAMANRLVGNGPDAAVLEMTLSGPALLVTEGGLLGLAGADMDARINGRPWSPGAAARVFSDDRITFALARRGLRAYLAAVGGFVGERWLESRSTDLLLGRGGINGRPVAAGDTLEAPDGCQGPLRLATRAAIAPPGPLRLLAADEGGTVVGRLSGDIFRVAPKSDRVGLRLSERLDEHVARQALERGAAGGTGLSEGMAMGSVEVTPGGEVIILLKARGTVGGYFVPAHVIRADWPRLAQLRPGDAVRMELVSRAEADRAARRLQARRDAAMVVSSGRVAVSAVAPPDGGTLGPTVPRGVAVHTGERLTTIRRGDESVDILAPHDGVVAWSGREGSEVSGADPVLWVVDQEHGDPEPAGTTEGGGR